MPSPRLTRVLCLLLAITAPHPNVAMASDAPAERTQDSSSGSTKVTVYCCEGCEISQCEYGTFESFAKIAETQKKMFSNEIIELVTKEKGIRMCFQRANTFPGGIYAIVWQKSGGIGHSCGNASPTGAVFSENGRGNMSTEENKICCEADTNMWEPDPTLKCYLLEEPYFLTSNKRNIGISLALVLLPLLCTAMTIRYFCRRHQECQALKENRQALEDQNLIHV